MNRIYKIVWSKAKGCCVVASEFAKSVTKGCPMNGIICNKKTVKLAVAASIFSLLIPLNAFAATGSGPQYENGNVSNTASSTGSTVGGGSGNEASGDCSTVGGGSDNTASSFIATVGGGSDNTASGLHSTVSGGYQNTASSVGAIVGGGQNNTASGHSATVSGGGNNTASGFCATVGGGADNEAIGAYSTAIGNYSKAYGINSFAALGGITGKLVSGSGSEEDPYEYSGRNAAAIGKDALAEFDDSIALGSDSVTKDTPDSAGFLADGETGSAWKATRASVAVGNADNNITRQITGLAAGTDDTDAVNVAQLKAAVENTNPTISDKHNYYDGSTTSVKVTDAVNALDTQVKANEDAIETNANDIATNKTAIETNANDIATNKTAIETNANDIATNKTAIETNANDIATNKTAIETNATNIAANKTAIDNLDDKINSVVDSLGNSINETNDRVNRVGSAAAALASLHYQPMAKGQSQIAVGMGSYKGKKATALGLAYQISDRVSGSVAGSVNGSEHMMNVGFNYLFGQHSNKDIAQCAAVSGSVSLKEAELQATVDTQNAKINNLEADNAAMKADNAAMKAKMVQLEAMVKALANK